MENASVPLNKEKVAETRSRDYYFKNYASEDVNYLYFKHYFESDEFKYGKVTANKMEPCKFQLDGQEFLGWRATAMLVIFAVVFTNDRTSSSCTERAMV